MKIVYVAGPFRAKNSWEMELNIRRAEELALECWKAGFATICPHSNTRFFQGAAPDEVWLKGDLDILKRCDAIIMTPDWKRSSGARSEHRVARYNKIPVFYDLESLVSWGRNS